MFNAVNFSDNVEMIVGALDPSARQKSCGPGSGGRDEPLPKKMNFIPPEQQQQKPTVLKAALNIDSRQLAEAMTYALADLHENSGNATSSNGVAMLDYNGYNPSFG
jgi:hypothetical protein